MQFYYPECKFTEHIPPNNEEVHIDKIRLNRSLLEQHNDGPTTEMAHAPAIPIDP